MRGEQAASGASEFVRILHVISGYLPDDTGGTQLHVRDLCHAQRALGHEPHVFARKGGNDFAEFERSDDEWEGVPVHRLTNNFLDVDRFELLFEHEVMDARFRDLLEELEPEVVHFHHVTCLSATMIQVAKERGLPVLLTLHDYWLICPRGQRIHPKTLEICDPIDRRVCESCLGSLWPHLLPSGKPLSFLSRLLGKKTETGRLLAWWEAHVRRLLDLCDLLITPSRFHRDRFVEWGTDSAKTIAIPHGLPRGELLAEPRGKAEIRSIGFIGTVIPSKGVHVLAEAFAGLAQPELSLEIHGDVPDFHGDRSYEDKLEQLIPDGLTMHLHGRYENRRLPEILRSLDVLVVPSLWWESFCLTAREGALAGLRVVGSRLGGIQDAVDDGLALGFEAGNAEDLARVLRRLQEDEELRDSMSRKAGLVRDLESCTEETLGHYERCIAEARSR